MPFIITECVDHGTKETETHESFTRYVELVAHCEADLAYERDTHDGEGSHVAWHEAEGHDCWVCCRHMVIDPQGCLDGSGVAGR